MCMYNCKHTKIKSNVLDQTEHKLHCTFAEFGFECIFATVSRFSVGFLRIFYLYILFFP